jgi:predicted polyphosphate/ATP-dependent NAD kinase
MIRIGFIVNPIAGMGGRVGLKGTDDVLDEAIARGASPIALGRAVEAMSEFRRQLAAERLTPQVQWLTCSGRMGADALIESGFDIFHVVLEVKSETHAADTRRAAAALCKAGVDLIVFCGGDGTARDIVSVVDLQVPILGIPSGVKMYSGVFGVTPRRVADILLRFVKGELGAIDAEVIDLDEERYRAGEWAVRRFQMARTPFEPTFVQQSKQIISELTEEDARTEIAVYVAELMAERPDTLFLLGPGSTVAAIADEVGVSKGVLAIDAVVGGKLVGADLDERGLLELLCRFRNPILILSPIGAQGFVLGRGNLQVSPAVIRAIGIDGLMVVATPAKLARTQVLRFDTSDRELDQTFASRGYLPVVTGYRRHRMVKVTE